LKKAKDFEKALGKKLKLRLLRPVYGRRNITGFLENFEDGVLYVRADQVLIQAALGNLEKANLVYEFGD
jgi:ribosome maturation factor RimP